MPTESPLEEVPEKKVLTSRESYNVATDTVAGVNVRWKDNLLQGIAILVSIAVGAVIGLFVIDPRARLIGAAAGAFIGMIVGLFGSGLFLMVYRGIRHLRGKHD